MEVEISLKTLLRSFFKHFWVIVIITLLVAILAAVYTSFFVTPIYTATAVTKVMINDQNASQGNNLTTTLNLMPSFAIEVKSDATMKTASDMIQDESYTPERIRSMVSVSYKAGELLLYISAVSTSPENAAILANTVAEAAAYNITEADWEINNAAAVPTSPSSPSLVKNVLLAAVVAFALTYVLFLLFDLYNAKITSEEQLAEVLGLPVVGAIPFVENSVSRKNRSVEEKEDAKR